MEQISYEENIKDLAWEFEKTLIESGKWQDVAALALQKSAEVAHAVNGPQLSKSVIDQMLRILGVIPTDSLKPKTSPEGR